MNILIENDTLIWGGGVESFLQILANELHRRGHSVTLMASYRRREDLHPWLDEGIRCIPYPLRKPKRTFPRRSVRWYLQRVPIKALEFLPYTAFTREHYDLVIASKTGDVMRRAAREKAPRRVVWTYADYSGPLYYPFRKIFRADPELRCLRRFESVICVSETVRDSIIETLGDPGNLRIRYLPVPVDRIREKARESCVLSRPTDRPLLVSVCRLSPEKQMDKLLEACALLREDLDFELWIVGEGLERPKLEEIIATHGLDFVRLPGACENPFPYMRQADLFVSASMTESYGLAVQEALALGIPVLAVGCRGIREALDTRFGRLTEDSAQAMAEGIRTLLQTPGLLAEYREAISRDYPADRLYGERLDAIFELLEQGPNAETEA